MKKRRLSFIISVVVGLVFVFCSVSYSARGVTKDTIKIGLLMVKTGPIAALGIPAGTGWQDYWKYINDTQGGINGRKIVSIWEDDEFKVEKAVTLYNKLMHRDKVLFIANMGGTPATMALMANINRDKNVTLTNSLEEQMFVPLKPYMFSVLAFYQHQIAVMFDYIMDELKEKDPKIGVVYSQTAFGKKCHDAAVKRAAEYNLKLVSELVLPHGAIDASAQVLALKKAGAKYVIFASLLPAMISMLKDSQKYDYSPTFFAICWATDPKLVALTGEAAKNFYGTYSCGVWSDNTPGMNLLKKIAAHNKTGKMAKDIVYAYFIGMGMVYAEGIKRCGDDVSPENLKKAFETMRNFDTQGIIPPVTFTPTNHVSTDKVRLFKADVPNKTLKTVVTGPSAWRSPKKLK
ncbi:MAG: ABC transporter substrate-binding protein [Thermodesulfobacteriota bacterium]|nr:ABC transporter substrate-binding protein [Thermodesulfobacteriota bacterium]